MHTHNAKRSELKLILILVLFKGFLVESADPLVPGMVGVLQLLAGPATVVLGTRRLGGMESFAVG